MFYQLLISVAVVAGLSVLWIGIQALARRQSGVDCESPDVGMYRFIHFFFGKAGSTRSSRKRWSAWATASRTHLT